MLWSMLTPEAKAWERRSILQRSNLPQVLVQKLLTSPLDHLERQPIASIAGSDSSNARRMCTAGHPRTDGPRVPLEFSLPPLRVVVVG